MAIGQVVSIPSNTHNQQYVPSGATYESIAILNPNDGVVFVSQDRDTLGTNTGQWDYKIPSQSYAALPGPWNSVGMYYLDQSGSGATGQITIYPIYARLLYPDFHSIGRALQAIGTALDIAEGNQPQNPGAGILRLWADVNNILHTLSSANQDRQLIDNILQLGGVLSGTLPNPGFATSAVSKSAFSSVSAAASTTSTTAGVLDTVTFTTLTANDSVRIDWTGAVYASLANTQVTIWIRVDGGAWSPIGRGNVVTGGTGFDVQIATFYEFFNLTAASHTFDIGWSTSQGTASVDTGTFRQIGVRELRA